MSESFETWAVKILDGPTVKRTLTASTTSIVYTAADQTANWCALLGPSNFLSVRVTQIGQTFRAGIPFVNTLWF